MGSKEGEMLIMPCNCEFAKGKVNKKVLVCDTHFYEAPAGFFSEEQRNHKP
jgi:hypothetical protein